MSIIIFRYLSNDVLIPAIETETISIVLDRFCQKIMKEKRNLCFLNNGSILNEQLLITSIRPNDENKIIILVNDINTNSTGGPYFKKSENIICPQCKESIIISVKGYKIFLSQCKNGHKYDNLLLSQFNELQTEDISQILCGICKKSKSQTFENKMSFCFDCKINICNLCISIHDNNHNIIEYEKKNYICENDGEHFTSYCQTCKKNLCVSCENDHGQHEVIPFSKLMKNKNELIKHNTNLKKDVDNFKKIINDITEKLNKVRDNIDIYFDINKMLINSTKRTYRNYEELVSINEINNNNTIQADINSIINENNINNQIKGIMEMYKKMEFEEEIQNPSQNNENNDNNTNINQVVNNNNIINNEQNQIQENQNNKNINTNNSEMNQNVINNEVNQNVNNNEVNKNVINNEINQNVINNEVNQNVINNEVNKNVINNEINQNVINNEVNQNVINNEININNQNQVNNNNNTKNTNNIINENNENQNNNIIQNSNINNNQINNNSNNNNRVNINNTNQNQTPTTPSGNNNIPNPDLDYTNNILNIEMYNQIMNQIELESPLISDLLSSSTLVKEYQNNLHYKDSIKIIADKYQSIRKIRRDGNCFYRGFIYRIFEYISFRQNNELYQKFIRKIEEAKDIAKKNNKLLTILNESYNLFLGEFCSCYNSLLDSNMSCRDYLDKLFHSNNKEKCNYLVLFIRYCIAEYIRENKILYEAYIEGDLENWIIKEVEPIDKEAEQVQIMACVNLFDIGVKIEYLNKVRNQVIKYPEGAKDEDIFIVFLYSPGHYDLLYDK
mgnify:CR=1 FL=1